MSSVKSTKTGSDKEKKKLSFLRMLMYENGS